MTRALLLLALVVAVSAGAWWFVGGHEQDVELDLVSTSRRDVVAADTTHPRPEDVFRPAATALRDATAEASVPAARAYLDDCVVLVRLIGPRQATNGAGVSLQTAYPQPEPGVEDVVWVEYARTSPDGVARFEVGRNALLHGLVVRHPSEWVWSSERFPTPLEVHALPEGPIEIEHQVPAGGGSVTGRALTLDGRRLEHLKPFLELTVVMAIDSSPESGWTRQIPLEAELDDDGRFEFAGLAGEFELRTWPRERIPLWTWRGTVQHGADFRGLDLVFAPTVNLSVRVPALADQPPRSVIVAARLSAAQRDALLHGTWAADPPAPPPGVERDDRVASSELDTHGNASLTVPQHAVWVSVIRGGAPLALRHNEQRVFEVLHDPVHGPLTLVLEEEP